MVQVGVNGLWLHRSVIKVNSLLVLDSGGFLLTVNKKKERARISPDFIKFGV